MRDRLERPSWIDLQRLVKFQDLADYEARSYPDQAAALAYLQYVVESRRRLRATFTGAAPVLVALGLVAAALAIGQQLPWLAVAVAAISLLGATALLVYARWYRREGAYAFAWLRGFEDARRPFSTGGS